MRRKIKINPNRTIDVCVPTMSFGVIGENNAEILELIKPETINGKSVSEFKMFLIFSVDGEIYTIEPYSDEFALDERFTGAEELMFSVQFVKDSEVKWKSLPYYLYLSESLSDEENHRNYLESIDFNINNEGDLIMTWKGGNIDFNLSGNDLEVDI